MAILVRNHHQSLDQAWRFTLREFSAVLDAENEAKKNSKPRVAAEHVENLTDHLKNLGVL